MARNKPQQNRYNRPTAPAKTRTAKTAPIRQSDSYLDELKDDIQTFFQVNDSHSFTAQQVLEHFDTGDRRLKLLVQGLIGELEDEGSLTRLPDGSFRADADGNVVPGVVDHVNARFAFVRPDTNRDNRDDDIWVSTDDLGGAIDGDHVQVVRFADSRNRNRRVEGRVVEVIGRGRTEMVGTMELSGNVGFVSPDNRKIYEDIFIPAEKLGGAKNNEKVIVRLTRYPNPNDGRHRFEGEVLTVLGQAGQNETEMHAILAEFGLPIHFPADVEAEANRMSGAITAADLTARRDMRTTTTFTIDPVDAKDFDDALSVQKLENGHYEIGVHIADVTHYVKPGTRLEAEAYARGTSVYLVDRVVPMLPEKLSNELCSLRPNEDKLTFSAVFELTPDAKIVHEWFGRTITHSDRRFAYEEAQEILNTGQGDFVDELRLLNQLAHKLRAERFRQGAIAFETVEVRFRLDENGVPLAVYPKIRQDTNKLIEEFMLLANRRVPEYVHTLSKRNKNHAENTMVYRVHENPDDQKLQQFADFAKRLGYKLNLDEEHLSKSMNAFMEKIEGKPEGHMLQELAVRTMQKARYSTEELGHFGLAFGRYSHFTSPIRRYPDMMAHRLLQHYLDGGKPEPREPLEEQCKHASAREKLAAEAERASIKYKQVEFMARMAPNQLFEGVISGVTEFGFFVEIPENSCEGLVRMQDLNDDFYEFDKDNYRIIGRRSKRMYTFGDAVVVRVKDTNLARRSIDFELVSDKTGRAATRPSNPNATERKRPSARPPRREGPAAKGQNRRGGRGRR